MLRKLWNIDFTKLRIPNLTLLWVLVAAYITYDGLHTENIVSFIDLSDRFFQLHPAYASFQFVVPLIGVLLFAGVLSIVLITDGKSKTEIGNQKFYSIVLPHFLVNIIDLAIVGLFVLTAQYAIEMYTGQKVRYISLMSVTRDFHPLQGLIDLYNTYFPTYVELPYVLAILATFILADLPIYILHYAVHWSRILWLVLHRSHHSPEHLHPFGAGPVFSFGVVILVPFFLVKLAVSKLVYPEPLLMELLVIQLVYFITEKFNHSSVLYRVAFKNKWIYGIFSFFGNGPYHITHHSAREGEEIVNLANVGFNFWDRLFGTFKKPDTECPPLGLTNQPKIKLNPFRLYLSGLLTILYELKHNSIKHWFKILFGSVYYSPPVTRDFLIESYPETRLVGAH